MTYLKLEVQITEAQFPLLEARLSQAGALSVSAMDAADQPILEPGPGETPLWHNLMLSALFPSNKNRNKVLNKIRPLLQESQIDQIHWSELSEQAWEKAWMQYYQPIQFDQKLWVGSTEHKPPADIQARLFLEPGLAFGTGSHPTTYLCLEWLSQQNLHEQTLLDYGCGSGILMLAALKLGAEAVTGVDLDPQALTATQDNAERNQLHEQFALYLPENFQNNTTFHIVIANILANPLIELSSFLCSLLKKNGKLVLSGLLIDQAEQVKQAYASQIVWQDQYEKEGWVCLVGVKYAELCSRS
jgi:ribosomal protein L11 methyltransferase